MSDVDYDSLVGTLFAGRFRIEKLLGRGGMGAVYLGEHEVLQRRFAIKVIHRNLLADRSISARFRREARAASRIDHPHVTYVFDYGYSDEGLPYLAMEYVEGSSLQQAMTLEKPFPIKRGLLILSQIAEGLAAAHAMLVIHRDLKPQNIILTERDGQADFVKILDFGLAKIIGVSSTGMASKHGELVGTPYYMSPEQLSGGQVDHRSDIYSFGVLAFELFVGQLPFDGTLMEVITAHIQDEPPVPSEMAGRADFPGQMNRIIQRCLAKKPEQRFQSATDLLSEISSLQQIFGETISLKHLSEVPVGGGLLRSRSDTSFALAPTILSTLAPDHEREDSETWERCEQVGSATNLTELTDADSLRPKDVSRLRSRALEELAYAVRDLGLGSAEISHVLAQKVEADELVFELASSIALQEADMVEIEAACRAREMQLRQALSQMEHERSILTPLDPHKTKLMVSRALQSIGDARQGRTRSGEFAVQDHRFRERIQSLQQRLQQISTERETQLAHLRNQIAVKQAALEEAQEDVSLHEEQLLELLNEVRDQIMEAGDPDLGRLLALSGSAEKPVT